MFHLDDVTLIYDIDKTNKVYAIKNITTTFPDHGLIGIIGPSGSGKSTLMYCMSTLKKPTCGEILFQEKDIAISYTNMSKKDQEQLRKSKFGFVFQRHFLISYMSALENVIVAANCSKGEAMSRAKELLQKLGIKQSEFSKKPHQLSGGQRQRIAIARAMLNEPSVLFADEPTASLDHTTAFATMDLLLEYAKKHLVLIITHDRSILKDADQIIEIWDGSILNGEATI